MLLLQADDLKYLGFVTVEVPETVYLLCKEAKLLQSCEELWEIRKNEILAYPDPLLGLSTEERYGSDYFWSELETTFRKYVKPGQIVFRAMPLTGGHSNEHVLRGFTTHFVIDSNILRSLDEVHKQLAAKLGSDYKCEEADCLCQRKLLSNSMVDALSRQKGGPSRDRICFDVMAEYMQVSPPPHVNLSQSTSIPSSPAVSCPNSAHGDAVRTFAISGGSPGSRPVSSVEHVSGVNLAALNISGGGLPVTSGQQGSQPNGETHVGASIGRPQEIRVVQEHETPMTPGMQDPVLFHNGIQAALASVLKHSAGQGCPPAVIRSCNHPSTGGTADTVTVRLCPNKSKNPLRPSDIKLVSCVVPGDKGKRLYIPVSFDLSSWSQAMSQEAQKSYELLERLHELFLPGVAPVNMYYDADDGCIAFNQGNKLWYNAHADHAYDQSPQGVRLFN